MKPTIKRHIERANEAVIDALSAFGVATIHEAQSRTGLMRPYMRPLFSSAGVVGSAVTVVCHAGDNLMIHAAIDVVRPGDVLVVATDGESTDGMFGELLAVSAVAHGVRGLVIDAGIRDSSVITTMRFPVWSKAICAQGTVKSTPGPVNVPIVCAGAVVNPGDIIAGDDDGVVVVPRASAEAVAKAAAGREAREETTRQRLKSGELGIDIYGLRAKLKDLGVEWID
jgi:4-hydroxy-4-methyl-2-oxoglutarate aldolase